MQKLASVSRYEQAWRRCRQKQAEAGLQSSEYDVQHSTHPPSNHPPSRAGPSTGLTKPECLICSFVGHEKPLPARTGPTAEVLRSKESQFTSARGRFLETKRKPDQKANWPLVGWVATNTYYYCRLVCASPMELVARPPALVQACGLRKREISQVPAAARPFYWTTIR